MPGGKHGRLVRAPSSGRWSRQRSGWRKPATSRSVDRACRPRSRAAGDSSCPGARARRRHGDVRPFLDGAGRGCRRVTFRISALLARPGVPGWRSPARLAAAGARAVLPRASARGSLPMLGQRRSGMVTAWPRYGPGSCWYAGAWNPVPGRRLSRRPWPLVAVCEAVVFNGPRRGWFQRGRAGLGVHVRSEAGGGAWRGRTGARGWPIRTGHRVPSLRVPACRRRAACGA